MGYSVAYSQTEQSFKNVTCITGPAYPVYDALEKYYFSKGDTIISVKIEKTQVYFQKFDKNSLKLISSAIADLPEGAEYEGYIELPNRLLFFYVTWDPGFDTVRLYSKDMDFTRGNLSSTSHHYFNCDGKVSGMYRKYNNLFTTTNSLDFFDMYVSADSSKLLIQYNKSGVKGDNQAGMHMVGLAVYDCNDDMKQLWYREMFWPIVRKLVRNPSFAVNNEGEVYSVGWELPNPKASKKEKEALGFKSEVLLFHETATPSSNPVIAKIDITGKRFNDASIHVGSDGKIRVAGYYRYLDVADSYYDDVHGTFNYRIDKSGTIEHQLLEDIPQEIDDLYYDKKARKSGKPTPPGAYRLRMKSATWDADGNVLFFGEQYAEFKTEHKAAINTLNPSKPGEISTTQEFRYNDIITNRFASDGKTAWIKLLKKFQRTGLRSYSVSYKMIMQENVSYLFFLDHLDNLNPAEGKNTVGYVDGRAGYLAVYRLDNLTGEVKKIPLFDIANADKIKLHQVTPARIVEAGPGEFIMEAYTGDKQDVLVKFSVPNID